MLIEISNIVQKDNQHYINKAIIKQLLTVLLNLRKNLLRFYELIKLMNKLGFHLLNLMEMLKSIIQLNSGFLISKNQKWVPNFSIFEPMHITQDFWDNLTSKQAFKNLSVLLEQDQTLYIRLYD